MLGSVSSSDLVNQLIICPCSFSKNAKGELSRHFERVVRYNVLHVFSNHFLVFFQNTSSVDDLRKLLSDKDAYHQFLFSLDQVKLQDNVSCKFLSSAFLYLRLQTKKSHILLGTAMLPLSRCLICQGILCCHCCSWTPVMIFLWPIEDYLHAIGHKWNKWNWQEAGVLNTEELGCV